MANPFGGSISGKNTNHASHSSLQYVFIPITTTSITEVLTNVEATITLGGGSLSSVNSDGFLVCGNTNGVDITRSVSPISIAGSITVISIFNHKTSTGITDQYFGLNKNDAGYVQVITQIDGYQSRASIGAYDGSNGISGGFGMDYPDNRYVGIATRTQPGTQNGRFRSNSSLNANGGIDGESAAGSQSASATLNTNNGSPNQLYVHINSDCDSLCTLVYSSYLTDGSVDEIFADPGDVLSYGGQAPRTMVSSSLMRSM